MQATLNEYACINHPILHPDSWSVITNGIPQDEGVEALVTCSMVCKARTVCPFAGEGRDIIAKGGWFTNSGKFFQFKPGWINLSAGAVYLGRPRDTVKMLLERYGRPIERTLKAQSIVRIEDIKFLAIEHSPPHGTVKRHRLHIIRGEAPCRVCSRAALDARTPVMAGASS